MLGPNVVSPLRDENNKTTYYVYAYRALSRSEVVACVRHYYSQLPRKKRKPLRNAELQIVTLIGASKLS